jgi:hypothetical protein
LFGVKLYLSFAKSSSAARLRQEDLRLNWEQHLRFASLLLQSQEPGSMLRARTK